MAREADCLKALDKHESALAGRKNVVGLGVVPVNDDPLSEDLAVAVYVERKVPESELSPEDLVPKFLVVDSSSVPTRVIEQGAVTLEGL